MHYSFFTKLGQSQNGGKVTPFYGTLPRAISGNLTTKRGMPPGKERALHLAHPSFGGLPTPSGAISENSITTRVMSPGWVGTEVGTRFTPNTTPFRGLRTLPGEILRNFSMMRSMPPGCVGMCWKRAPTRDRRVACSARRNFRELYYKRGFCLQGRWGRAVHLPQRLLAGLPTLSGAISG